MAKLRQQQKENTRKMILETAYSLFAEVGYDRTTMRELAERAGVGVGTVFKHFPGKPSLLAAAYLEDMGEVIRTGFATVPEKGIRHQLEHITSVLYAFYSKNILFSRPLVKESLCLGGDHGAALKNQLNSFLARIAGLVSASIQNKELPPETDPFLTAQAYGSFYLGALVMGLHSPEFDVQTQAGLVSNLMETWLGGTRRK